MTKKIHFAYTILRVFMLQLLNIMGIVLYQGSTMITLF